MEVTADGHYKTHSMLFGTSAHCLYKLLQKAGASIRDIPGRGLMCHTERVPVPVGG